jgi:hypothetical protein
MIQTARRRGLQARRRAHDELLGNGPKRKGAETQEALKKVREALGR